MRYEKDKRLQELFDKNGYYRVNLKGLDLEGYDEEGYKPGPYGSFNREGYDRNNFNIYGIHKDTKKRYDLEGYDKGGFDIRGIHKKTKDIYDENGLTKYGFNKKGYYRNTTRKLNDEGYDINGFNQSKINIETGTKFDIDGYDYKGYNEKGFDREGYNKLGYDESGYDRNGFNVEKIHKDTNGKFDPDGYDAGGFDEAGIHKITKSEYDEDGYNRAGYDKKGFDREGYNERGYNQAGYDRNNITSEGINRETGEKDTRIILAEEFISFGQSLEQFVSEKQMSLNSVKASIESIRTSPCVKEQLDQAFNRNSNRFMGTIQTKKEQLLAGKIGLKDIHRIQAMLKIASFEEREKITEILAKGIASGEIKIIEYANVFGLKIDRDLPKNILEQVENVNGSVKYSKNKEIRMLAKDVYKEMARIKSYATPYKPTDNEKIGYYENSNDREPKMFDVTDENREMAREYLIATTEFICEKTMRTALLQIAKGELDAEKLERARKEKELRELQKEDKDLDETIQMAEKVLATKEQTRTNTVNIGSEE